MYTAHRSWLMARCLSLLLSFLLSNLPLLAFTDADWVSINSNLVVQGASSYPVTALAVSETNLYLGGKFSLATTSSPNIAKWNGLGFSGVGGGMNGSVGALLVSGANLYAGGGFTMAGRVPANHIAKWDGNTWSALGWGVNGSVLALAVVGTNLYIGGIFTDAGGVPVNNIARWDGTTWSALGSGVSYAFYGGVYSLAASGTNLFVGGRFTDAGGVLVNNIAKWDGFVWSSLGTGVTYPSSTDCEVFALAVSGTDLYVGGVFKFAGWVSASGLAKWNGEVWSGLGTGVDSYPCIQALAVIGTNLYAAGQFTQAGGIPANRIAKWDGTTLSPLGSGINGNTLGVFALAGTASGHLFVGGQFTAAGTSLSPYLVMANVDPAFTFLRFDTPSFSPLTGFSCTFRDATPGVPYRIQAASPPNSWTDLTNFIGTAMPIDFLDPAATNSPNRLYRSVSP